MIVETGVLQIDWMPGMAIFGVHVRDEDRDKCYRGHATYSKVSVDGEYVENPSQMLRLILGKEVSCSDLIVRIDVSDGPEANVREMAFTCVPRS